MLGSIRQGRQPRARALPHRYSGHARPPDGRIARAKTVAHAVEAPRAALQPIPHIADDFNLWRSSRLANALNALSMRSLAPQLSVRVPWRRQR